MISRVSIIAWCRYLFVFFLFRCGPSPSEKIEHELILVTRDNIIDQGEYDSLLKCIEKNNHTGYNRLLSRGSVDHSLLRKHIEQIAKPNNINVTALKIWNPSPPSNPFNINVYLENSASMNGYVGAHSSFKTNLFKLLTDLKSFGSTRSLNLRYINTNSIPIKENASPDDIKDFESKVNPAEFRKGGGNVSSTNIEKMLKMILDDVSPSDLNIFISDCVFSPGKANAKKFLTSQYTSIYSHFTFARQKQEDLTAIILQCSSRFEGSYFDHLDTPHRSMDLNRPYYIWFIGARANIQTLIDKKIFELLKDGYTNKLVVQSAVQQDNPRYKILLYPRIGTFNLPGGATGEITDAEISHDEKYKHKFGLNLVVDFTRSLQDSSYFSDVSNYRIGKDYKVTITSIAGQNASPAMEGFSHRLSLETTNLQSQQLTIDVLGKVPAWVYDNTSYDDTGIEHQPEEAAKTFGLKYLVEGVCDAFYPKSQDNVIATISISIKK